MKLILAHNRTQPFVDFYADLQQQSNEPFHYTSYQSLLFIFDTQAVVPVIVRNLSEGTKLTDYDGVYINGYLHSYELAASVAICCDTFSIPFINTELRNPPSLSKLTSYARLASGGVRLPKTLAGTQEALLGAAQYAEDMFPAVLKRADADRGIDNFKVSSFSEVSDLLQNYDEESVWIFQSFIPNSGFYLVNYYDSEAAFCIYRTLEERPDGDVQKAHMYKPKGGVNANLIPLPEVPPAVLAVTKNAVLSMNRQIGSVDCLISDEDGQTYIMEVNFNPQLVTIQSFKRERAQALVDYLQKDWKNTE